MNEWINERVNQTIDQSIDPYFVEIPTIVDVHCVTIRLSIYWIYLLQMIQKLQVKSGFIFFREVPHGFDDAQLTKFFSRYGRILRVRVFLNLQVNWVLGFLPLCFFFRYLLGILPYLISCLTEIPLFAVSRYNFNGNAAQRLDGIWRRLWCSACRTVRHRESRLLQTISLYVR